MQQRLQWHQLSACAYPACSTASACRLPGRRSAAPAWVIYFRRRANNRPAAPRPRSDIEVGSGTSEIVRLSQMSALSSWLLAAELPLRPVSSAPNDTWLPLKVRAESGTVVMV